MKGLVEYAFSQLRSLRRRYDRRFPGRLLAVFSADIGQPYACVFPGD
jgi:hypothetical protein